MATPSAPPPAGPTALIGPQFCAPYAVDLTVKRKVLGLTDDNFSVTDVNGIVVLKVKGSLFSIRDRCVLVDAGGSPILSMQQKILSTHRRWQVFRGQSSDSKDLLFSVKKSSLLQFKTTLDVFLAANTREKSCDFKIKGSFFDRSCVIYLGDSNTIVAQMRKHHTVGSIVLGKDTFCVTVYPHIDYAFIIALIVILHQINKDKNGND